MRSSTAALLIASLAALAVDGRPLLAQGGMTHTPGMQHTPGMEHGVAPAQPTQGGQAVFAAVTEIVKILEADSTTDWARVDLEALRRHLIDMDLVTMRSHVRQVPVDGGLSMDITGDGTTAAAIRRMVGSHAPMLQAQRGWRATATPIAGGMRFTVVAATAADSAAASHIRGLGFIGLMVQGEHHMRHHLMIARGAGAHAHDM